MEMSSQKTVESINRTVDTVSAAPGFALKRGGESEDMVTVTDAERSLFQGKKLVKQLVFTEFGLYPVSTPPLSVKSEILPFKMNPKLIWPSPSLTASKSESLVTLPQDSIKAKSGSKQCRCKRSKCLQLYCECFAIGAYCNGCNCSHCHNNVACEELRKAAAEIILERNPLAFRPKIASSPCSPQDNGDDAGGTPWVGRHNRGCNCKRSECLKKYCECFRANVFCYENCKCTDCKNYEGYKEMIFPAMCKSNKLYENAQGCEESFAISKRDNGNVKICKNFEGCRGSMNVSGESGQHSSDTKLYVRLVNTVISDAMRLSGHGLSQESRKRKIQEYLSIEKDTNQMLADYQQVNPLGVSHPLSGSAVDPVSLNNGSAASGSFSHPYRSLLPSPRLIHPDDSRELCSGLLLLAEAANVLADKVSKLDMQEAGENQKANVIEAQNKKNNHNNYNLTKHRPAGANGEGMRLPSGTLTLICNDRGTMFMEATSGGEILRHGWDSAYAELEGRALASFKDCLEKLITFTNKKARAVMGGQFLQVSNPTIGV
ncbi:hypothetical protein SLE2022_310570 [Rubroshorea leprosula]